MAISLLCPTRKRPDNVLKMVNSAYDTALNKNIEFLFYVDEDDDSFPEKALSHVNYRKVKGQRIGISSSINKLASVATN